MGELLWVGGEQHHWKEDAPPVLAVVPPDTPVEVRFEASRGAAAEVVYTLDGGRNPVAPTARHLPARRLGPGREEDTDLWSATIPGAPAGTAVRYMYVARREGESAHRPGGWTSYVVSTAPTSLDGPRWDEAHPASWLRPAGPVFPSPEDWGSLTIYHVLIDRFCDGDPMNNRLHYAGYDPAAPAGAHGGDLAGLRARLDYIRAMGFRALWLSPVLQNWQAYHGFNVCNFLDVDRRLGTLEDLRALVADAHAAGMWVILDMPLQHMAGALLSYADDRERFDPRCHPVRFAFGADSPVPLPLPTFFRDATVRDSPRCTFGRFHRYGCLGRYDDQGSPLSEAEVGDLFGLSDLATEDAAVRAAMVRIAQYWIAQTDADGMRLDAVKHAELGYWQALCPAVRDFAARIGKRRFFLFGEFVDGRPERLGLYTGTNAGGPAACDAMEDYPLYFAYRDLLCAGGSSATIEPLRERAAASGCSLANITFLDNHDQRRALELLGGRLGDGPRRLRVALALLLLGPGVPAVYYGTEQSFDGSRDHRNREDMFFNPEWAGDPVSEGRDCFDPLHPLYRWIRRLHVLRQWHPVLARGGFVERWHDTPVSRGVYVFSRLGAKEEVVVALNSGPDPAFVAQVPLPDSCLQPGALLEDALSDLQPLPLLRVRTPAALSLELPPYSAQVWVPVVPAG